LLVAKVLCRLYREAQFLRLRERIEHIASTIFDEKAVLKGGVLRIFSKHIGK